MTIYDIESDTEAVIVNVTEIQPGYNVISHGPYVIPIHVSEQDEVDIYTSRITGPIPFLLVRDPDKPEEAINPATLKERKKITLKPEAGGTVLDISYPYTYEPTGEPAFSSLMRFDKPPVKGERMGY